MRRYRIVTLLLTALAVALMWWIAADSDASIDRNGQGEDLGRFVSPERIADPEGDEPARVSLALASESGGGTRMGSLQVAVWYGSGASRKPACGFPIVIKRYYGIDTVFGLIRGETNGAGFAVVPDIPEGPVLVYTGRQLQWWERAIVKGGRTTRVDLELKDFVSVEGVVLNEEREPIPGATIEAVRIEEAASPVPVGVSDSSGRFKVSGVPTIGAIGARAPGYVAARLRSIAEDGRGETKLEVEFVLARGGGSVAGVVRTVEGVPVKGARVRVGTEREREEFRYITLADGSKGYVRAAIEEVTDDEGEFRVFGLLAGEQMVRVKARDAAPWIGSCRVTAGAETQLTVNLSPGVSCEGVILEPSGRPARLCRVRVDTTRAFFKSEALTDRNGAYRLTGIAPGSVRLRAEQRSRFRASVDLHAVAGETLTWSPRLGGGIDLRGRVVTDKGRPLQNVRVQVAEDPGEKTGSLRIQYAETDAEGRFKVSHVEPGPILFVTLLTGVQQPRMLPRVDAAAGECVFRVPDPGRASAAISGAVRGSRGEIVRDGTVHLKVAGDRKKSINPDLWSGRFELTRLLKGPYVLSVQAPGYITEVRQRDLKEGEHWVAGDIVLERSGWVVVPITDVPSEVRTRLLLTLRGPGARQEVFRLDCSQSPARSLPVRPGTYSLEVGGEDMAAAIVKIDVQPGIPTEVTAPIQPGRRCVVRVHLPPGSGETEDVKLVIRTGQDVVLERYLPKATGLVRPLPCSLGEGEYEVRASLPDGRSGVRKVRVDADVVAACRVDVEIER